MPAFVSPLMSPDWSYTILSNVTIPKGLRYEGYKFRGLRATIGTAEDVCMPALGILRKATDGGKTFVEVQVNPFPIRRVVAVLPWGLPTFYLIFDDSTGLTFTDGQAASASEVLREASAVTILMAPQTRVVLDPVLWSSQIATAITVGGGPPADWQEFADAVAAAPFNSGNTAPVMLLDHNGQPRTAGIVDVDLGPGGVHRVTLSSADGGDLQQTMIRTNAIPGGLFGSGPSFRLRPFSTTPFDFQLVRLDDGNTAHNEITLTRTQRHVSFTDLNSWFAPQSATPVGAQTPALENFTRGNKIRTLVNGPEFFDDFFEELKTARDTELGLHLAGWAMLPEFEFTESGDALTLAQAAKLIGDGGGHCCFLPSQLIQLEPGKTLQPTEVAIFFALVWLIVILSSLNWVRVDGAGVVILFALLIANPILMNLIFSSGGTPFEQNKEAVDVLDSITNSTCRFSPYPATIDDNTAAHHLDTLLILIPALLDAMRRFGVHHQKLSIIRNVPEQGKPPVFIGYCGGIDFNSDRMDDADHLAHNPFHDVHARIEGPAVRDLALTFEERWKRDVPPEVDVAFETPEADVLGTPGNSVVQVARTYFAPQDPARRFDFAPAGDGTIAKTIIRAINAAKEFIYIEDQYFTPPVTPPAAYQTALVNKVSSGDIRQLIITLPGVTDQPFGEIVRSGLAARLITADAGRGIVQIGYPRRRYTVPDNELRASSGRCILGEDLDATLPALGGGVVSTIVLGPKARVPVPPFWVAVDGELMWVYDEFSPAPDSDSLRFKVERGDQTQLVKGGISPRGAKARNHKKGAAATVINLSNIYVHAKMMIVDDVFLSIGSANLNRRGFFHDGEINVFVVPEDLKRSPSNPVASLRKRLWAEMMDLPAEMVGGVLQDPVATATLFGRSPFSGNRYVDIAAYPAHIMLGATTGDGLFSTLFQLAGFTIVSSEHVKLFDNIVDPSSSVESTV